MKVIIESPWAGEVLRNQAYAKRCLYHSLMRGEAPLAFHMLYTQVLEDQNPDERLMGIARSQQWYHVADAVAVYHDYGISRGMELGIQCASDFGLPIHYRKIGVQ